MCNQPNLIFKFNITRNQFYSEIKIIIIRFEWHLLMDLCISLLILVLN